MALAGHDRAEMSSDLTVRGIDLERSTVLDLQRAMDSGQLTAVDLTGFYLRRNAELGPTLRAVIESNPDALEQARHSDDHRRRHGARGPMEGIPVLLKDNIDTTGPLRTTAGSYALSGSVPTKSAFLVRRLERAGAVVLGKANLSEWARFRSSRCSSGWSARGGQAVNPYVLDRTASGSSTGSAIAAAAHLAAVAIGTETNGSIVCPAGMTSTVGLKPTVGAVSRAGIVPITAAQDTAGPLTRSVSDAAVVLSVIAGADPDDPATLDVADQYADGRELLALDVDALRGRRIGVWRSPAGDHQHLSELLDRTATALTSAGATVVDEVELTDMAEVEDATFRAMLVEFRHDLEAYLANTPGRHPRDLAGLIAYNEEHAGLEMPYFGQDIFEQAAETSGDLSDHQYRALRRAATDGARKAIDTALENHHLDAIVASTNNTAWTIDPGRGDDLTDFVTSSAPAAVAGYPNITVPAGFVDDALPLGVSFFGARFGEPTLLQIAYGFEQRTRARRPPAFRPTLP